MSLSTCNPEPGCSYVDPLNPLQFWQRFLSFGFPLQETHRRSYADSSTPAMPGYSTPLSQSSLFNNPSNSSRRSTGTGYSVMPTTGSAGGGQATGNPYGYFNNQPRTQNYPGPVTQIYGIFHQPGKYELTFHHYYHRSENPQMARDHGIQGSGLRRENQNRPITPGTYNNFPGETYFSPSGSISSTPPSRWNYQAQVFTQRTPSQ